MTYQSAQAIAVALGGEWKGHNWMCPCPAHDDKTPSLSVKEGHLKPVVLHCFAGCTDYSVMAALEVRGLWGRPKRVLRDRQGASGKPRAPRKERYRPRTKPDAVKAAEHLSQTEQARERMHEMLGECQEVPATMAEDYLYTRGIEFYIDSNALRFHSGLWHAPTKQRYPALVAIVFNPITEEPITAWRTFINRNSRTRMIEKASRRGQPIPCARMALSGLRTRGGIIPISNDEEPSEIVIGEGLETAASAGILFGLPAWAAISSGNLKSELILPPYVRRVIIAADNDRNGAGQSAARAAYRRWEAKGLHVEWELPDPLPGRSSTDFNDILLRELQELEETRRHA